MKNFVFWVVAVLMAALCGAAIGKLELLYEERQQAQKEVIYRSECDFIPTLQGNRCSLMNTEIPDEVRPWIPGWGDPARIWI